MKKNEFKCAVCGGIFEKSRTDEEANEEAKNIWGVDNADKNNDMVLVCDDCFNHRTPEEIRAMGDKYKSLTP